MVSTAEAAKVQVFVQTKEGKVLPNPTVSLKGQTTAAKAIPSSPAVFNVAESKLDILIGAEGKQISTGLVLPAGDSHVVMVTLPVSGNRATARVVTADEANLARPFWLPRDVDYVHGQSGIQQTPQAMAKSPVRLIDDGPGQAVLGVPCGAATEVTDLTDPNLIEELASIQCSGGGIQAGNENAQQLNGTGDVQCVEIGIETNIGAGYVVSVQIHAAPTGDPDVDLGADPSTGPNLLGAVDLVLPECDLCTATADFSGAGVSVAGNFWVVQQIPDSDTQIYFPGANFAGTTDAGDGNTTSFIQAIGGCGITWADVAGFGGGNWVMNVGLGTPEPGACCDTSNGNCTDGVLPADCEGVSSPGQTCLDAGCDIVIPGDSCGDCFAGGPGTYVGDTCDNTDQGDSSCGISADSPGEWICYTATCNGTVDIQTCNLAAYDTVLSIQSDCAGTEEACNDDGAGCAGNTSAILDFPIVAGETYNIRVTGFLGACGEYTLDITETCEVPDTGQNDCVAGPSAISGEGTFAFDNTGAGAPDGPGDPLCNKFGSDQIDNDVWFCWTSTCEGEVRIETCGLTAVDTKLAVYDGCDCPAGPGALDCNDDTCATQSQVQFTATNGGEYLIRVGTFPGAAGGPGEFSVTCVETGSACNLTDCQNYDVSNANNATAGLFNVADNFSPSASGAITEVCWWGAYIPAQEDDDFTVTYYDDGGGLPGAVIGSFSQSGGSITVSGPVDTGDLVANQAPIFSYSGTHAPVDVTGGDCYWLEVSNAPQAGGSWFWEVSFEGDLVALQDDLAASPGYESLDAIDNDTAWCLDVSLGDPTPCFEPPVICGPGAGDCTIANGTPGCDDVDCCELICGLDPFCCDTEWDGVCADAALVNCVPMGACCQGAAGCSILSEADCSAAGGLYQGDDTACDPDPCDPIGACCVAGDCSIDTEANCDAAGGIYNGDGTDCSSNGPQVDAGSSSPALAIPDGDPVGTTDSLNLAASNTIGGVEVDLDVSHTWLGDLCVTLEHAGTSVTVVQRIGEADLGCGGGCCGLNCDNMLVTLSDGAASGIADAACAGDPGVSGTFIPQEALSAFAGLDAQGDWTLTIADNAGQDTGTLNSWGIRIFGEGQDPCEPVGACCGCPDENACTVTTEAMCTGDAVYLGDGTNCDLPPGNSTTIESGDLGLAIPDSSPGAGVSHDLNMGMSYALADVNVDVNISHTWLGDLCVSLEHAGTTVSIIERIGEPGLGCAGGCCGLNCDNMAVTLDDAGASNIVDAACAGDPGVSGLFIPQEALAAFNGLDSAGVWTLTVEDNATGDTGTLDSWALTLTEPAQGGGPCEGECSECGNGILEAGEDCDDGNLDDGDCCSSTCTLDASGTACGDASDSECTNPDTCDGAGNCQANDEAAGTLCGSAANECSDQDTCNGSGICSSNDLPAGTACGEPADPENCFSGDSCTGGGVCQPGFIITECGPADGCCNAGAGCDFTNDPDCPEGVPTVSEWGLVILALLLAIAAKVYWNRREAIA